MASWPDGETCSASYHGTRRSVWIIAGLTALLPSLSGGDANARTVAAGASDRQPVRVPLPAMWNVDGIQDRTGTRRDAASVEHPYSPVSVVLGTGARGPGRGRRGCAPPSAGQTPAEQTVPASQCRGTNMLLFLFSLAPVLLCRARF